MQHTPQQLSELRTTVADRHHLAVIDGTTRDAGGKIRDTEMPTIAVHMARDDRFGTCSCQTAVRAQRTHHVNLGRRFVTWTVSARKFAPHPAPSPWLSITMFCNSGA